MIHPSAIIDPEAELDPSVEVGPFAVIEAGVRLGAGCAVGPHVHLLGPALIGAGNRFHTGAVIGDAPQDLAYTPAPTGLVIGDQNVFREHVTVHRSSSVGEETRIGSHCFLMAHSHVGHNCRLGDRVIMANGATLGGYVELHDRAFISGNCLVHQFVRVGQMALMQGGSAISKDLPPCTIARGDNGIAGLNVVGMRRAGLSAEERLELRRLYHAMVLGIGSLAERLEAAEPLVRSEWGRVFVGFFRSSRRGCVSPRREARAGA
ncbi:MAG: acyl-ACP--UDP-N-acetylglucosamine O-acyltransferase [Verrucomicrobiales bacterium]|nr:acyl-ACP--UDP-N-acetylglucosamine O-acyltransferase [Verrucomicrobiales bacterium]